MIPATHRAPEPPSPDEVVAALAASPMFHGAPEAFLATLAGALRWSDVPGGTRLIDAGDAVTSLGFVLHGALRVRVYDAEQAEWRTIEDLGVGDLISDSELLGDRVSGVRVDARRDSEIGEIGLDEFLTLIDEWPAFWKRHSHATLRHVAHEAGRAAWHSSSRTLALIFVDGDGPNEAFAQGLQAAIARYEAVSWRTAATDALPADATRADARAAARRLAAIEASHPMVVLQTDPGPTPWTLRCIRNADEVLVVTRASAAVRLSEMERYLHDALPSEVVDRDLVLIQELDCELPTGTANLLALRPGVRHLWHVKLLPDHLARLARGLTGRRVGLVLGGGGGRGNAHIGVYKALLELGVPIDATGGTSAGGGIAAMIAAQRSAERVATDSKIAFVDMGPFHALDLPYLSLLEKSAVEAPARWLFGDYDIEDLWLPFYAVSCDLVHSEKVVHRRGRLWKALRATTALPGILPPVFLRGRVLIDGGVVDNTPVGVMKAHDEGPTIVVNVSPPDSGLVDEDLLDLPTNRDVYLTQLHPLLSAQRVPSIGALVVQTMCMSGMHGDPMKQADLAIEPDIARYGTVDMEPIEELIALGYNATMAAFEARHDDAEFLAKFGLQPGSIAAKLPRVPVPYHLQAERTARRARRRAMWQAGFGAVVGGVIGVALPSVVAGAVLPHGGLLGAAVLGGVPLLRAAVGALLRSGKRVPA
jgi:predicted acylesterase/phospholipase RssA/CRP-like cAMP-binding protein